MSFPDEEPDMNQIARLIASSLFVLGAAGASDAAMAQQPDTQRATKEQAVAMVQKAVAAIKQDGAAKAYPVISDLSGPFVQGDLYVAVIGFDGTLLAYGSNEDKVGNNLLNLKDVDGKEFVKERLARAKTEPSFWQSYKFANPVTKTIEPKQMYCERLDESVVCAGVYE
jgi:signal transduction histidine kinase